MKFAIITHVPHICKNNKFYAYAPYVREMNIWAKFIDKLVIIAPINSSEISTIDLPYEHLKIKFIRIPSISFTSFTEIIKAIVVIPFILFQIGRGMILANHIHLRCPGNIGLIGCCIQIFFLKKIKTAKYAGNWDPMSKQPLSYRFQKWLLSNTFLTRNMQVLVYGKWPNQSKNIKPFFTASYSKEKIITIPVREFKSPFSFLYVGSLVSGKCPIYAIQLVKELIKNGFDCKLDLFGEGAERTQLEIYISEYQLSDIIKLHGNQKENVLEEAYKESDFLILPSQSEGWPKVVAEAMFWGLIPIVTKISCVPWMLGEGTRGILINNNLKDDVNALEDHFQNSENLKKMSKNAQKWSQQFTLDNFEDEINKLV